jgi:Na+-driven multidrug efflux pump
MGPVAAIYLLSYWCIGLGAARWLGEPSRWGLPGVWLGMGFGVFTGACWLSFVTVRRIRRTAAATPALSGLAVESASQAES